MLVVVFETYNLPYSVVKLKYSRYIIGMVLSTESEHISWESSPSEQFLIKKKISHLGGILYIDSDLEKHMLFHTTSALR